MQRREFLRAAGALGAAGAVAGCLGGGAAPPPRQSEVFEQIQAQGEKLQIQIEPNPAVESRADVSAPSAQRRIAGGDVLDLDALGRAVGALSPVGVASAAKGRGGGGRGATGRGTGGARTAPTGTHGRAKYHGGDYGDDWRENHQNDIEYYRARVATVGIARIGSPLDQGSELPGAGPVDWDETWDVSAGEKVSYDVSVEGWYRTGSHLVAPEGGHDFGWEAVDSKVVETGSGFEVQERWKVSPRL